MSIYNTALNINLASTRGVSAVCRTQLPKDRVFRGLIRHALPGSIVRVAPVDILLAEGAYVLMQIGPAIAL